MNSTDKSPRANRWNYGPWVFCLAYWPPGSRKPAVMVEQASDITSEAAAVDFFKNYLDEPGYFLVKIKSSRAYRLAAAGTVTHGKEKR